MLLGVPPFHATWPIAQQELKYLCTRIKEGAREREREILPALCWVLVEYHGARDTEILSKKYTDTACTADPQSGQARGNFGGLECR